MEGMNAKAKAKQKLLEYLGNPNNNFLSRIKLSTDVLGYKSSNQLNSMFTAAELAEIEWEALELRKKNSAKQISRAYAALERLAAEGNVQAIKEYLDRIEGKVTDKLMMDANVNADVDMTWKVEIVDANNDK